MGRRAVEIATIVNITTGTTIHVASSPANSRIATPPRNIHNAAETTHRIASSLSPETVRCDER